MKKTNLIAAVMLLLSNALFALSFAAPLTPIHQEPVPLKQTFIYLPESKCGPTIYLDNEVGWVIKRVAVRKTEFGTGLVTNWAFTFTPSTQPTYPYLLLAAPGGGDYSVNVFYEYPDEVTGSIRIYDNYPGEPGNTLDCRSLGVRNLPLNWTALCGAYTVVISSNLSCQ
jgi:hypothetical protein